MSLVPFLISFFLIRYIRNLLQTAVQLPACDKVLVIFRYVAMGLVLLEIVLPADLVIKWIWDPFLLLLLGFIWWRPEFFPIRGILYAILPFVLVSLISNLVRIPDQDRFDVWADYIDSAQIFTLIWMVAMLINYHKQNKALALERQRTKEEAENSRLIDQRRLELENLVAARTAEISMQKEELQKALEDLKATQTQLIQREKLASLGELTAGIAHEIQNPLNFVNNFAEVSEDLCRELQEELAAGNNQGAAALVSDLVHNQKKILQHGQRADAIVKGMLLHSHSSTGQKELTDVNALADEYLGFTFHGLKAKDKNFNASLVTDYDNSISKVAVVPQDLGRVLLNIFNNAFYATQQKKSRLNGLYQPEVKVSTRYRDGNLEIKVRDNGSGIPDKVRSKIFQPFFTTKPAGQGTGLGLSLSYDIIKAHGGELQVETQEGEYTEFNIKLPVI